MLDNAPLAELLARVVPLPRLLGSRHLQALAITASGYGSGEHVTFYQSAVPNLAAQHIAALPRPVRALLGGVGVSSRLASQGPRGAALASDLLFEAPDTQALIALGEADTLARRDEVLAFFDWHTPPPTLCCTLGRQAATAPLR